MILFEMNLTLVQHGDQGIRLEENDYDPDAISIVLREDGAYVRQWVELPDGDEVDHYELIPDLVAYLRGLVLD